MPADAAPETSPRYDVADLEQTGYGALVRIVRPAYIALYVASALGAYSVGPVPIQWFAQLAFIALGALHLLVSRRVWKVPGAVIMLVFLGWAVIVNALNAGRFEGMMPAYATLPYWLFVTLRYASVLSFLSAFYLGFWLLWAGRRRDLSHAIVRIGVIFAVVALYIYVAGLVGLPEPPRTRLGTGGFAGQVTAEFSSAGLMFRRAIGTFREPSHLADWLLLPFFLSLGRPGVRARVATALIALTLLLTVSLQGIISVIVAMAAVTVLTNPFRAENLRRLAGASISLGILLLTVGGLSIGALGDGVRVIDVIDARTAELSTGGVGASSRSSVVDLHRDPCSAPAWIRLREREHLCVPRARVFRRDVVPEHLRLRALLHGIPWAGAVRPLQVVLVGRAVIRQASLPRLGSGPAAIMAFVAYMVSSGAGMEELTIPFGIAAAFIAYEGFARHLQPEADGLAGTRP